MFEFLLRDGNEHNGSFNFILVKKYCSGSVQYTQVTTATHSQQSKHFR